MLSSMIVSFGAIGPQMKDFLCGCEYCVTVNRGEPLDIATHLMKCHSWRKGMVKTIELMNQTPVPEIVVKEREPITAVDIIYDDISPYKDYKWRETNLYGWSYMTTDQQLFHRDQWIYLEDIKWVWSMVGKSSFLYSYEYGWLYNAVYQRQRVIYWYDRRIWMLASNIE